VSALDEALRSRVTPPVSRYRVLVIVATALIIVILAIGLYLVYQDAENLRENINRDFNRQQLTLARQAAGQIAAELRDIRTELERFSRYQLRLATRADTVDAVELLVEYARNRGIREIGVFSREGQATSYYSLGRQEPPSPDMIERIYAARKGRAVILTEPSLPKAGLISRTVTGLLCVPSERPDGLPHMLYARIDVTQLVGGVAGETRSGRTGAAWVIDGDGTFLYHERSEYVARNAFRVRKEYHPDGDFSEINRLMREDMLRGLQGTGSYLSTRWGTVGSAVEKLVAYTAVSSDLLPEGHVWSVAVAAPVNEVAEAVRAATTRHIIAEAAMLASIVLLGLLALLYERRISRALRRRVAEQETYLSTILQNSIDGIILIDPANRVLVWNRGAEMIFGYSAREMLGQSFHPLVPPDMDAEEELQAIESQVRQEGFIRNHRVQRMTRDGRRITVDLSRTAVYDENGEFIGSVAIIKDVTEEVEMEQRMYNTEKLASIGTLAAGVAHEINNPLAVILGFTDLLREKFRKGTPEWEDLGIIEENAENAKRTVEHLLGFARVQEGQYGTVDVAENIRTVLNMVTTTVLSETTELVTDIPDNLPPIRGEAREFQQVLFNLINNAIAAVKDQERQVLGISAWVESRRVCVRVTDNGPGIPDRIKGRIFDPFFTTKKVGEGTGLGLSLSYGIVKKYGGSIDFFSHSAEDNPDDPTGTAFTVAIPMAEPVGSETKAE
jgi:PAS domain S-box-containing protein